MKTKSLEVHQAISATGQTILYALNVNGLCDSQWTSIGVDTLPEVKNRIIQLLQFFSDTGYACKLVWEIENGEQEEPATQKDDFVDRMQDEIAGLDADDEQRTLES